MTISKCESLCSGYTYAGVENGGECYCGNTITNNQASTGCTTPCLGDSTKTCGGGWAVYIYQYTTTSGPTTTSSVSTTTTSTSTTTTASAAPTWTSLGCYADQNVRTLSGPSFTNTAMTPAMCESLCAGYTYAGVEFGQECYCGSSLTSSQSSTACTSTCGGDSSKICGGAWAINIYQAPSGTPTGGGGGGGSSTGAFWSNSASNSASKYVVAHFIVGNSYSYTPAKWQADILLAAAQGIDGFALNVGSDSWEPAQMQSAYDTALAIQNSMGITFKMFISFDMTSVSCGNTGFITGQMQNYKNHPMQLRDPQGAMWVGTFAGDGCFDGNTWRNVLNSAGVSYHFIPAFFNQNLSPTNTLKQQEPAIGGDFLVRSSPEI